MICSGETPARTDKLNSVSPACTAVGRHPAGICPQTTGNGEMMVGMVVGGGVGVCVGGNNGIDGSGVRLTLMMVALATAVGWGDGTTEGVLSNRAKAKATNKVTITPKTGQRLFAQRGSTAVSSSITGYSARQAGLGWPRPLARLPQAERATRKYCRAPNGYPPKYGRHTLGLNRAPSPSQR